MIVWSAAVAVPGRGDPLQGAVVVQHDVPAGGFLEVVVAHAQRAQVVLGGGTAVLPLDDVVEFAGGGGLPAAGVAAGHVAGADVLG